MSVSIMAVILVVAIKGDTVMVIAGLGVAVESGSCEWLFMVRVATLPSSVYEYS